MQPLRPEERREFQRLHLTHSIAGTLAGIPVKVVEVGILGARLHHVDELRGEYAELRFQHGGHEMATQCELVRANAESRNSGRQSPVRFLAAIAESGDRLRALLALVALLGPGLRRAHP